jgi:transcription-repair coupling factor (superfamily II helicase)
MLVRGLVWGPRPLRAVWNGDMKELVDALIQSDVFGTLLAAPGRKVARADAAGHPFVVAALAATLDAPVLAVAPGPREADRLKRGAAAFLGSDRVALFPAWEALPGEGISPGPEVAARRAETARRAKEAARADGPFILVAPVVAALQPLVPTIGTEPPLVLDRGVELAPDGLADRLVALGFVRSDLVTHRGEFAVRGGIVDVFPGAAARPVRLEFWGDELERIRHFSPATQTSSGTAGPVEVGPVRELLPTDEVRDRARAAIPWHKGRIRDALERLSEGLFFEGMEGASALLFEDMPVLADLLGSDAWVVLAPSRRTLERARSVEDEAAGVAEATGWEGPPFAVGPGEAFGARQRVELTEFAEGVDLEITGWGALAGKPSEVARAAADLASMGYRVALSAEGRGSLDRALEVLDRTGMPRPEDSLRVVSGLLEGFVFGAGRVALVGEDDLFGRRRVAHSAPRLAGRSAGALAAELTPGDHAVHRVHGVGRYVGMTRRAVAGSERDYLLLDYAAGDRLFVPADQVDAVARYVGGEKPRLHRLGGNEWPRAQARVRRAVQDMAGELVRLYSARMAAPGYRFGTDTPWQGELEDAFPFEETPDQRTTIDDVKGDMESQRPMDRLICGDVGYGKTEIAVRAAFKAVMEGKQAAVLVPTTLLAEQHYVTFGERFAPFPVRVAMLSRFLTPAEQKAVLEELAQGKVDVIVGTHRLLSSDVRFKDLGLLIVDEEQRFGVAHKEKIKRLRLNVDVLTMTATPIPRTLEMALAGIRDLSVVDTPPEDRQPVLTYVGPWEEEIAIGAIRRELRRGGQAFWVHNDVRTIDHRAATLAEKIPEARVGVAHGQMDEGPLEKVMMAFWNAELDVLVCTTIIESGLDVPTANTLVVERADRLGLSQLHQIRGRVGRSAERAFAYLFFPPQSRMTEEAHERLAAISRHTALGSGFPIAMKDLEIRGAGNLLGAEQHGHIAAVGFDTYSRLLAESVSEMKGEPLPEERDVRIDIPVRAFIPVDYSGDERLRLELYRRIASARSEEELDAVRTEAEDRFGPLPIEVVTLVDVARLRIACLVLGVEEVTTYREQIRARPVEVDDTELPEGTTYHEVTRTLNLNPAPAQKGPGLPAWIRMALLAAARPPAEVAG